jgi:murein DD-endopeptidase MepM/ murein hydrolase activator NlpD
MAWSGSGKTWGVPWLGLPLSGVLALTGAAHSVWSVDLVRPRAAVAVEAEVLAPAPAESAPVRLPDRTAELRSGETLSSVLLRLGLGAEESHAASLAAARHVDPRQLRAGTPWNAYFAPDGSLERFEMVLAGRGELAVDRGPQGWVPHWQEFARQTRVRSVRGQLDGSLEASVARSGAAPELAYRLADVLQWDLDFSRDLRRGDEFRILYEELLVEGHEPRPERVLAVAYGQSRGRQLEAYYFGEGETAGYYDGEGRPLQKLFLRSPLPYSRVTSGFSHRRFHPVLGRYRPHYGVDYGAPVGTPVRVTASGTVESAGWAGGGGKTVKVRHANGYLTAYLHLSRFASGLRAGSRVRQGDVIGYVGATGLATGPHLDYRVQLHGRWINPLTIKAVPAEPIPTLRRAEFAAVRESMRASLEIGQRFAAPAAVLARSEAPTPRSGGGARAVSGSKR